jgi:hypothetical protein
MARHPTNYISPVDKIREYISMNICYWCNMRSLSMQENAPILPDKDLKIDWSITGLKIAVFYEGGKDVLSTAKDLGWQVVNVTQMNYRTVHSLLEEVSGRLMTL